MRLASKFDPRSPWGSRRARNSSRWDASRSATWGRPSRRVRSSTSRSGDRYPFLFFDWVTHAAKGPDLLERHRPEKSRQCVSTDQTHLGADRRRDGGTDPAPDEAARRARAEIAGRRRERDVGPLGDADPQAAHRPRRGRARIAPTDAHPGPPRRQPRDRSAAVKRYRGPKYDR